MRPRNASRIRQRHVQSTLGRQHKPDYWLLTLCSVLLAIGLVVVYAISPALSAAQGVSSNFYVLKQLAAIALSLIAFMITAHIPLRYWQRAYKPLLIAAALVTLLALVMPVNPQYPAHRWLRLGSFSFQSVELVKFAILVAVAGFLAARIRTQTLSDYRRTLKPLIYGLVIVGVLVAGPQALHGQSDFGSMGVMVLMVGSMCFIAGMPMKRLMYAAAIIIIGGILVILPSAYRRERLTTFLHPQSDCQDAGYQACQALITVGSGGMIGLGLGRSVQAYGYLPEAANDSIFAIYAEKFGFIGCVVLLGIFAAFFHRMKLIAERAPDDFSRLLVIGVLAWLSVQALVNIGAMVGLLPLKGITLPFISYGGTSVVFSAAAVGLVFQVSRYAAYVPMGRESTVRSTVYDDRRDGRRVRGAYHPDLGSRL